MSYFAAMSPPKRRRIRDYINRQESVKMTKSDSTSSFYRLPTQSRSGNGLPVQVDQKSTSAGNLQFFKDLKTKPKSSIIIETEPTPKNLAKCHWQEQSPLFRLPVEIRQMIFELATSPCDDPKHKPPQGKLAAQTGRFTKQMASTSILGTCRRAWLETNALPLRNLEHRFWFCSVYSDAEAEWTKLSPADEDVRLWKLLTTFTPNNRRQFEHLRIFASMWWLENRAKDYLPMLLGASGACPRVLTITVRHTDLWLVEEGKRVEVRAGWLRRLLNAPSLARLAEIRLELETLDDTARQAMLGPRVDALEVAIREFQAVRTEATMTERGIARRFALRDVRVARTKSGAEDLDVRLAKMWPKGFHLEYVRWTLVWRAVDEADFTAAVVPFRHREDSWIKRANEQYKQDIDVGESRLRRFGSVRRRPWWDDSGLLKIHSEAARSQHRQTSLRGRVVASSVVSNLRLFSGSDKL